MSSANPRGDMLAGRYLLHGEIASGGMATILLAQLVGSAGFVRTVAIKRLYPQFAKDPDFVAMFLDEARLAARIQHPNVVPILDVVATEGELSIVMELVQGETLAQLVRVARKRSELIDPRISAAILVGALHGLHAAHEARDEKGEPLGIVHRDVSPQNVLVGIDGVARVLDFGIAKAKVRLQMTREGQIKGKLAYMAPEQLLYGNATRASDVYAAGILLWEALTGVRLFDGENEAQLLTKVAKGMADPPSLHVPDLPQALDAIVRRALERDPRNRFASAREMALALERSVELAMPSEVGDWVRSHASDNLAKRAARIAEIESGANVIRKTSAPPPVPSRKSAGPRPDEHVNSPSDRAPTLVTQPPSGSHAVAATRRKILVIDDSEVILARIRAALEADGYDVVTSSRTVGNARHIASCDIAIVDYHMPGIDGGAVIASLRQAASGARGSQDCLFYLYTSDVQIARQYKSLGFDGSFTEKGDEEALVRQLRAVFRMLHVRALAKKPKDG